MRIRSTSRAVFFLKLGRLSGCFDRILLLSASSGYHTLSEGTLRIPAKMFDFAATGTNSYPYSDCASLYIHVPALPGCKGILRVPNRRCSRYPHAGRQNAVYCQTLERLFIIKERKILQVEVPAFTYKRSGAFGRSFHPVPHLHNLTRHTPHRKEYTMLWDTHMHTAFLTDSETSPESMIKALYRTGTWRNLHYRPYGL